MLQLKSPFSCGLPMAFLWFTYGFPMVFLWFASGFPIFSGLSIFHMAEAEGGAQHGQG